eukprot:9100935-Pyramimonas_sp.AAC.1
MMSGSGLIFSLAGSCTCVALSVGVGARTRATRPIGRRTTGIYPAHVQSGVRRRGYTLCGMTNRVSPAANSP